MAKIPDPSRGRGDRLFKGDSEVSVFLEKQGLEIEDVASGASGASRFYSNYVRLYETIKGYLNGKGEWDPEFYADQNLHAQKALKAALWIKIAKTDA